MYYADPRKNIIEDDPKSVMHHDHIMAVLLHKFDEAETIVSRNDGSVLSKMMQITMP